VGEVTGAAVTSFDITGLDGDRDGTYLLDIHFIIASGLGGNPEIFCRPNAETTNLTMRGNSNNSGGDATISRSDWFVNWMLTPDEGHSWITIHAKKTSPAGTATKRYYQFQASAFGDSGNSTYLHGIGQWNETSSNITSLRIIANQTAAIAVGSHWRIYRRAQG
jgi:hypothetical protein